MCGGNRRGVMCVFAIRCVNVMGLKMDIKVMCSICLMQISCLCVIYCVDF